MAFKVSDFMGSVLPGGGARTGLFKLNIPATFPDVEDFFNSPEDVNMACQAASIPSGTIEPIEVAYMGRMFKLAGGRTFDEWPTTILVDEDYKSRHFIERWMDEINGNSTNRMGKVGTNYMQNIQVQQFSKGGQVGHTYTMMGAWPSSISEITLDWNETGTIAQFECSWAFQWWESIMVSDRRGPDLASDLKSIAYGATKATGIAGVEAFKRTTADLFRKE